jgi:hypothetical protein
MVEKGRRIEYRPGKTWSSTEGTPLSCLRIPLLHVLQTGIGRYVRVQTGAYAGGAYAPKNARRRWSR